jgi:hypothetical protein
MLLANSPARRPPFTARSTRELVTVRREQLATLDAARGTIRRADGGPIPGYRLLRAHSKSRDALSRGADSGGADCLLNDRRCDEGAKTSTRRWSNT